MKRLSIELTPREQKELDEFYARIGKQMERDRAGGTVYFIMCEGYVKIGHTTLPASVRLSELQVGNPFPLKLIREIPGTEQHEEWLHVQFEALRIKGEWFNFCDHMMTIQLPRMYRTLRNHKISKRAG